MSKIIKDKNEPKMSEKTLNRLKLIEYLNKHKSEILSMSSKYIIYSLGIKGLSQSTIYRIIKKFKDETIKSSIMRLCPQLIDEDK